MRSHFISNIFVRSSFQNYLGINDQNSLDHTLPMYKMYRLVSPHCLIRKKVETLGRSACIFMCPLIKKPFGTSSIISDQASMYMCSLVSVVCSRQFSVVLLLWITCVISVLCLSCSRVCGLEVTCWERTDLLALVCDA